MRIFPRSTNNRFTRHRSITGALFGLSILLAAVALVSYQVEPADAAWTNPDLVWESEHCGETETLTVPAGVTAVRIYALGGRGGAGAGQGGGQGGAGALPAAIQERFAVSPGQTISMVVGCSGASGSSATNETPTPGWATGGGAGRGNTTAFSSGASGGAGGGATGVCIGSATCAPGMSTLRIVAGGGGGGGVTNCDPTDESHSAGGNAGTMPSGATPAGMIFPGEDGESSNGSGGAGGSGTGDANGGTSANGSGGLGVNVVGGGGGGGYAGGAAGEGANTGCVGGGGGGGGSSYIDGSTAGNHGLGCESCAHPASRVTVAMLRPVTFTLRAAENPALVGSRTAFIYAKTSDSLRPVTNTEVRLYSDGVLVAIETTNSAGDATFRNNVDTVGDFEMNAVLYTTYADSDEPGHRPTATLTQHVVSSLPTTVPPTTATPTTATPTTAAPTTATPTTAAPTTAAPTTATPTTATPTTAVPTTAAPTTTAPTTVDPTETSVGSTTTVDPAAIVGAASTARPSNNLDSPGAYGNGAGAPDQAYGTGGRNGSGRLPATGSDMLPFILGGLAAICAGAGVLLVTRERRRNA